MTEVIHALLIDCFDQVLGDVLDGVTPAKVRRHLAIHGWRLESAVHEGDGERWSLYADGALLHWVMVPTDPASPDFRSQMTKVLWTVLVAEDWPMRFAVAQIFPHDLR